MTASGGILGVIIALFAESAESAGKVSIVSKTC